MTSLPRSFSCGATPHVLTASLIAWIAAVAPAPVAHAQDGGGGTVHDADLTAERRTDRASSSNAADIDQPPPDPEMDRAATRRRAAAPPRSDDGNPSSLIWVEGGLGFSYVNLGAINYDNLYPAFVQTKGTGPAGFLAAGLRFSFLTVGARASLSSYEGFEVGTVTLEAGLRLPTPFIQPHIHAGLGYGWNGDANYSSPSLSKTSVYGVVIDAGLGLDVLIGRFLSIGIGFDASVLNFSRQAVSSAVTEPTAVSLTKDGDAVGIQLRGQVHAGLRF